MPVRAIGAGCIRDASLVPGAYARLQGKMFPILEPRRRLMNEVLALELGEDENIRYIQPLEIQRIASVVLAWKDRLPLIDA